jgi:hypothetical protein
MPPFFSPLYSHFSTQSFFHTTCLWLWKEFGVDNQQHGLGIRLVLWCETGDFFELQFEIRSLVGNPTQNQSAIRAD